jgi:hypothetical protein
VSKKENSVKEFSLVWFGFGVNRGVKKGGWPGAPDDGKNWALGFIGLRRIETSNG